MRSNRLKKYLVCYDIDQYFLTLMGKMQVVFSTSTINNVARYQYKNRQKIDGMCIVQYFLAFPELQSEVTGMKYFVILLKGNTTLCVLYYSCIQLYYHRNTASYNIVCSSLY